MFVSKLQQPDYARLKMAYNGWPGRAPEGGVAWAVLWQGFFWSVLSTFNNLF